jgi:hypothetical protein
MPWPASCRAGGSSPLTANQVGLGALVAQEIGVRDWG